MIGGRRTERSEPREEFVGGGRITAITDQAHDPERVSIALDGAFAFGLSREVAATEALAVGDDLDPARVASLRGADEAAKATTAALAFLATRPRSEQEVRRRLLRKGFASGAIEATISRLYDWRYLDDAEFARRWVEQRATYHPRGRRLLQHELHHKGIDRQTVEATIGEADLDEAAAALELARAKIRSYHGLEPAVARRRLGAFLARRGYNWDIVRQALDAVTRQMPDDDGEPAEQSQI